MDRKQLGGLIRRARDLAGWSTTGLALKLDVSGQSVSLAERGGTPWPRGSQDRAVRLLLDALADKYGTERASPKHSTEQAARLLAVASVQVGLGRCEALADWG